LLDPGKLNGPALKIAGAEGDSAYVVGEEAAVRADARKLAINLGQAPDAVVEAVLVVVDVGGESVQPVDGAFKR
jgi:hypothetical protein